MDSSQPTSTQPVDPDGETGKLCNWVHSITLTDIPEDVQARAKYLILDGLACGLVGAHLPWSEKAANAVFEMEPPGSSGVFGWNTHLPPLSAALLNSSFIQGFELDDWHSEAPMHSNAILLPALFAATDHLNKTEASSASQSNDKVDGPSFLLAYLVGLEVGPRIGNALYGSHMLSMGWHSGDVFGHPSSALSVSKLMKLPPNLMEDAVGIACTQSGGLMSAQFESEVKRMQHGFAARNGLFAALMARGGYVGIKKVFERPYGGFLATFSQGSGKEPRYCPDEVTKELGTKWQTWGARVKPYAAMAGTHPTIDCIRKLQEEHPEKMQDLQSIVSIKLDLGDAAFHHGGWEARRPLTATGAQMSNSYIAATQLVDGQVLAAQFRHDMLERDLVWELVDKTTCYNTMVAFQQRATIAFSDETTLVAEVIAARGVDPPLSNEEVLEKWRLLTKGLIDDERREKIEKLCLGMESLADVSELGKLMSGVTRNPIA